MGDPQPPHWQEDLICRPFRQDRAAPGLLAAVERIWHFADDTSHPVTDTAHWLGTLEEIERIARTALAEARREEADRA
jgi:hypothetical protein